jgi:hypothetical protein
MPAMFDVQCRGCGKRYGFAGERLTGCPPCPRCGREPAAVALAKDHAEIERFKELLRTRPSRAVCGDQRVKAGLTLRQAAKLLGVQPIDLAAVENGRAVLSSDLANKMVEVYCLDPQPPEGPC